MKGENAFEKCRERGAALMTVLVASMLLGTACIALLSAVASTSSNNTDALNEAKAYWAAESGLQATINYLRNTNDMTYSEALNRQSLGTLPVSAGAVGSETSYTILIENPDGTLPYRFHTGASFREPVPTTSPAPVLAEARVSPPSICIPNCGAVDRTEVSFAPQATDLTVAFPNTTNYPLGTFQVSYAGNGAPSIPAGIVFRIEYYITSPRGAHRTIRGSIAPNASPGTNGPVQLSFESQEYELIGSLIEVCDGATPSSTPPAPNMCTDIPPFTLSIASSTKLIHANITDAEPYRLKVTATGAAPMRAQKKLEGIIIKDLINGFPYTSALTMVGPGASLDFEQGTGNPIYCGYDQGYEPGEEVPPNAPCTSTTNLPSAPSIGVTDPAGLEEVYRDLSNPLPNPPPDLITDGPAWQHSAEAMHEFITTLKTRAMQGSTGSLYLPDGAGVTALPNPVGNFAEGTGLTFCEGNCSAGPIEGGGILVVNGNFEYNGNFDFRGTIIVIGSMHRNGAGNGAIVGGVIVAPYDSTNLAAGFGSPSFTTTGGGTADIIFSGDFGGFDGTNAVRNVMIGVAEK